MPPTVVCTYSQVIMMPVHSFFLYVRHHEYYFLSLFYCGCVVVVVVIVVVVYVCCVCVLCMYICVCVCVCVVYLYVCMYVCILSIRYSDNGFLVWEWLSQHTLQTPLRGGRDDSTRALLTPDGDTTQIF